MRYSFFVMLTLLISGCFNCSDWGSYELGNNLVLLEGDRTEDRVIVYCNGRSANDCCHSGSFILPTHNDHMLNGKYNSFVKRAVSNDEWVIAELVSVQNDSIKYGLINLDFDEGGLSEQVILEIIESKVIWPVSELGLLLLKDSLKIDLAF